MSDSKDLSAEQIKTFALDVIKELRTLLKPEPIERVLQTESELPEKQRVQQLSFLDQPEKPRIQPSVEKQLYFLDQDVQHLNEMLGLVIFALLLLAIGCYICFQQLNQRTRRLAHVVYHHYVATPKLREESRGTVVKSAEPVAPAVEVA